MKRKWIRTTALSLLLLLPSYGVTTIKASEVSVGVVVERNFTAEDRFTLELHVKNEGGYIVDGSAWISKGIIAYELPVQTKKTFQIKSEKGYKVKRVEYEQPEIGVYKSLLPEIKDGTFDIDTISTKIVVTVEFERDGSIQPGPDPAPDPSPDPGPNPSPNPGPDTTPEVEKGESTGNGPSTGDNARKGTLTVICISSFILLLYIKKKKRKETYKA